MANKVLLLGETGTGKSTSLRNLDPKETFIINVINKPLPFKGWRKNYQLWSMDNKDGNIINREKSADIVRALDFIDKQMPHIKNIVVDDAQYIMSYEFMNRATETGFNKFTEIAQNMLTVFRKPDTMRDDITVIYVSHSEDVSVDGKTKTKIKTIGKMLDEKITLEGLFTVVLQSLIVAQDKTMKYCFRTNSDGVVTCKSPMGMFNEMFIDNDMNEVLKTIKKYNEGE